jgi:hypothetical protein
MSSSRCQYHLTVLAKQRNEQARRCDQKPKRYIVVPDRRNNISNTFVGLV